MTDVHSDRMTDVHKDDADDRPANPKQRPKNRSRAMLVVAIALAAGVVPHAAASADEVAVTIPTRTDVTESFTFERPAHPIAAVVLFPGGEGSVGIRNDAGHPVIARADNFLIRVRQRFVAAQIAALVLDAPSDHADGITEAFRKGTDHARDVGAVLAWLRPRVNAPIWLVGTSMGSVSAAAIAIRLGKAIDGVALTSPVSAAGRNSPELGLSTLALEAIIVPALVMDHALDACRASPPGNAAPLARRLTGSPRTAVTLIVGGRAPRSGPCTPLSYHGYLGVEDQAVATIVDFIKAK
jgi:pimeloyl-ACP methyl ester carboxylesterase